MEKNTYYRANLINRILGRKLACGERAWYVRLWENITELFNYYVIEWFKFYILGKQWEVWAEDENDELVYWQTGFTRREALDYVKDSEDHSVGMVRNRW